MSHLCGRTHLDVLVYSDHNCPVAYSYNHVDVVLCFLVRIRPSPIHLMLSDRYCYEVTRFVKLSL